MNRTLVVHTNENVFNFITVVSYKTSVSQDLGGCVYNEQCSHITEVHSSQQSPFFYTLGITAPSVDNTSKLKSQEACIKVEYFMSETERYVSRRQLQAVQKHSGKKNIYGIRVSKLC